MKAHLKNIISRTGSLFFYFKKKKIDRSRISKILVMSLYFKGDVLFNTAAIRTLRRMFPYSTIDVMVKSRSKDVLSGNPDIDNIIVFDDIKTADYNDNSEVKLKEKFALLKKLRNEKYDLCIDFTGKYSTALLTLAGRFKYSFGLNYNGFGFCYSGYVNTDTQNTKAHLSEKYLNIIKRGFEMKDTEWAELNRDGDLNKCKIYIDRNNSEKAETILNSLNHAPGKPLICIQATAGWKAKEWDEKNYSELLKKLIEAEYSFVLIGSDEDSEINFRILDSVSQDLRKHFLSYPLKLNAAVISLSDLFIGSDSIGLHIAGAAGTPSIGLFGPTNPGFSNPPGEIHTAINKKLECSAPDDVQYCTRNAGKSCPSIDCMNEITANEVMENAAYLLNKYFYKKRITA